MTRTTIRPAPPVASPAEEVQALKLPEYAGQGMVTHHLEAAVKDIELAEAATRVSDKVGYAQRAEAHLLYARRATASTIAAWRECNQRADKLIARLAEEGA